MNDEYFYGRQIVQPKVETTTKHMADCKIKPNTLHKKTAETLMVID